MKRKLISVIISIAMVIGLTSTLTFAESKETDIETVAQLKSALGDNLSTAERAALVENVKDEVIAEFMEEKMDKAVEIISGQELDADMQMTPDGSAYGMQKFDLGDGCVMTVELSDCAQDQTEETDAVITRATSDTNEQWGGYGNRSFTAKASVNVWGVMANMTLVNNYTLSVNGIEERPGAASGYATPTKTKVSAGMPNITDSVARTPGASDVNMNCIYTLTGDGSGGSISKAKYKLNTTIGYVAINKTSKKIKVRQSWSLSKVS